MIMQVAYHTKAFAFVRELDDARGARVRRVIRLLEERGYALRMPFSKSVAAGLFELRVVGALQVRLLFFFHKDQAVIAHAFFKKTEALSHKDIEYAQKVRGTYMADS